MPKQFNASPRRLTSVTLLFVSVAIVLLQVNRDAEAQFRIPGAPKIPNIPIPNIGGTGSRPGNQQDLNNLLDLARKFGELCDLDNPQRQQELGQTIALSIANRYPVSRNRLLNQYINLVGLAVVSVSPRPELSFAFGVLDTPEVGAYSTPGGYIFVTRGALGLVQDESELAGVLAHEIAHVVLNHGIDAVKNAKLKQLADTTVQKFGGKWTAYSQYVQEGTDFVLVKGYSQEQERQADAKAIEYLILAGYDPRGFVRFLDRMEKQTRGPANPNIHQQMFSTHPGTAQRIGNTTRQIASYKTTGGVTLKERYAKNVAVVASVAPVQTAPAPAATPAPAPTRTPPPAPAPAPAPKPSNPFSPFNPFK